MIIYYIPANYISMISRVLSSDKHTICVNCLSLKNCLNIFSALLEHSVYQGKIMI